MKKPCVILVDSIFPINTVVSMNLGVMIGIKIWKFPILWRRSPNFAGFLKNCWKSFLCHFYYNFKMLIFTITNLIRKTAFGCEKLQKCISREPLISKLLMKITISSKKKSEIPNLAASPVTSNLPNFPRFRILFIRYM